MHKELFLADGILQNWTWLEIFFIDLKKKSQKVFDDCIFDNKQ